MTAVQKSCIHASAVAVFVEWWIVVFVDICSSILTAMSAVVLLQYTFNLFLLQLTLHAFHDTVLF